MLRRERHDGAELLVIEREHRGNSMNSELSAAFAEALAELDGDGDLRAVVITGAGEKFFCAGGDIKEYGAIQDREALDATFDRTRAVLDAIEALPVPVIAAVNGYALGGGGELMLACDLRLAASHARIGFPQSQLGIIPAWHGIERLVRDCGPRLAMRLAMTGEQLDAEAARAFGLIDEIVAERPVLDAALEMAASFDQVAPLALAAVKRIGRAAAAEGLEAARQVSREATAQLWFTADHREAEAAFAEKRPPKFRGV
ncbi:MAG: enoyl-CoA hydratase/isomerase family protein [Methyloligellaceae bacterium]